MVRIDADGRIYADGDYCTEPTATAWIGEAR